MKLKAVGHIYNYLDTDKFFNAKIIDLINAAKTQNCQKYIGFLNSFEVAKAVAVLGHEFYDNYKLFGGADEASRQYLCVSPAGINIIEEDYPITIIECRFKIEHNLNHRDFLGAILSQGVKRETIGDIIIYPKCAYIMLSDCVAPFIILNLIKIGAFSVDLSTAKGVKLKVVQDYNNLKEVVSSARVDNIISALINISRNLACELINSGNIIVNNRIIQSNSKKVEENSIITIKHHGKFIIDNLQGQTRKGKIIMLARQYK